MCESYYLISDLHIGGDEQLQYVPFQDELLDFLKQLEESDEEAELIINGDLFGLWEFTELHGMAKFDALVRRYPELFEQLRRTGERIPITVIPGNHDYELAAYAEYVERLAEYNVTLEQEIALIREVGDRSIYIEHGMQRDPNNRIPDFRNPYANPPGYFVNQHITSQAGKISNRGRANWLRDIQAVTPMTLIPEWMISNYFYREMSPFLRYASVPFFLLFNMGVLYVLLVALYETDIWRTPLELLMTILRVFGAVGDVVEIFFTIYVVIIILLIIISIPLFFFGRDVYKTLRRFGLLATSESEDPAEKYLEGAREIFESDPNIAVFVYGHTHRVSLTEVDGRVVINTGTWLKRLHRQAPYVGILPPVFYSSYRLNYFRITAGDATDEVVVEYHVIPKADPKELTLLERLVAPKPSKPEPIPDRTVVGRDTLPQEAHLDD